METTNYIQCTGTQYIDTGYMPNGTTKIVIDCMLASSATGNQPICGARKDKDNNAFVIWGISSATLRFDYGATAAKKSNSNYSPKDRHIYTMSSETGILVDGVSVGTLTKATFTSSCNLVLSAVNTNGTITYGKYSIYSCQIYDNGTLVRDYIPWIDANGVYCLKDKVNNALTYSATSAQLQGQVDIMAYATFTKIGSSWKEVDAIYVNVEGYWKEVECLNVKVDGAWKESG